MWLDGLGVIMSGEMRDDGHQPATKADLRGFATKADLRGFATKADLREFATKAETLFATKADMKAEFRAITDRLDGHDANLRRLNISFARLEGDMTEVKGKVGVIVEDFSQFKTFLERMNGNIEAALRKTDLQGSMLMDHEGRLKKLESRPS